jgi:hypothetical protein
MNVLDKFSKKYPYIKFHENPFVGSRVFWFGQTGGQMDLTKIMVAFRSFTDAPKKGLGGTVCEAVDTIGLI